MPQTPDCNNAIKLIGFSLISENHDLDSMQQHGYCHSRFSFVFV